ncbi:DUF4912 domain-containing protein [Cyanobacteria bacterium FACHB-63]|nr:DUF4912 domain-containing protein [Cyanobacteria bacterium FACHB-63]
MLPNQKSSALGFALLLTTVVAAKPLEPLVAPPTLAQTAPPTFPLPSSVPAGTTVQIDGSSSMATTNQALKQRFESQFSGSKINLNYSGSAAGLQALRDGKVDLAAIGRSLTQSERNQGLVPVAVGRGKIALIISPENSFRGSITVPQFVKVVRGEITDWSELGGTPGRIRFIDRPDLSDTRTAFRNYSVFINTPYQVGATAARTGEDSTQAVAQQLGKDGLSFAPANQVLNQANLRIVPMHNTLPTDSRYPFSQPFYYVHKANPSPGAAAFLGYTTANSGVEATRAAETDPASLAINSEAVLAAGSATAGALNSGASAPTASPAGASPAAASSASGAASGTSGATAPSPASGTSTSDASTSGASDAAPLATNPTNSRNDGGVPGWLWWLLPLGLAALLIGWLLRRRSTPAATEALPPPRPATPPPPPPLMNPSTSDGSLASRAGSVINSDRAAISEVQPPTVSPAVVGGAALAGAGATSVISDQAEPTEPPEAPVSIAEPPAIVAESPEPIEPPVIAESTPVPDRPLVEIREMPAVETPTLHSPTIEPPEAPPEVNLPTGAILGGMAGLGAAALMREESDNLSEPESLTSLDAIEPLEGAEVVPLDQPAIELNLDDAPSSVDELAPVAFDESLTSLDTIEPLDEVEDAPLDLPSIELDLDDAPTVDELPLISAPDVDYVQLDLDAAVPEATIVDPLGTLDAESVIPGLAAFGGAAALSGLGATESTVGNETAFVEPTVIEATSPEATTAPSELSEMDAGTDLETDEFETMDTSTDETDTIAEEPSTRIGATTVAALGGMGLVAGLANRSDAGQTDVEAARFDLGQTDFSSETLASVDEGLPELPDGYGESRIVLMPRDPQWAYAYWDIPNEHRSELRNQGGQALVLRLADVTDIDLTHQSPHNLQQFECDELARDWYVPIPVSDRDYLIEIGYLTGDGGWLILARSLPVRIPPVYPSTWEYEQFATVPWGNNLRGQAPLTLPSPLEERDLVVAPNAMYDRIFDLSQGAELQRIAGSIFGSMQQVPVDRSVAFPSGAGLLPPTASGITSGIAGMSGIGLSGAGLFSGSAVPIRPRRFWLVADAELIVYGATEPDATVTIAGETIPLNPDGTFRFQMSFQDGLIDYPILAVAKDGAQTRSIHLKFTRDTPSRNTNTKDEAIDEWQS